jgi:hypothetical protein
LLHEFNVAIQRQHYTAMQNAACAFALAFAKAGNSIAAEMAIMAITTSSSISVNAVERHFLSLS